jgi:hypothetical protein
MAEYATKTRTLDHGKLESSLSRVERSLDNAIQELGDSHTITNAEERTRKSSEARARVAKFEASKKILSELLG